MADSLQIFTLGGLAITRNGEAITGFASRKAEALLVYLACNRHVHQREVLADLLWDDRPQRQAMANLRVVLSSLRKEVGNFVTITRTTVAIAENAALALDAAALAKAVAAVRGQDDLAPAVVDALDTAADTYRGDFLEGFFLPDAAGFEAWVSAERERLHRLVVDGLQVLARWQLAQQAAPDAVASATRLLAIDSLSEAGHRYLMEALARNGQRSQALQQYETCRTLLQEELGVAPAPETEALYAAVRAGEVAPLSLPPSPAVGQARHTLPAAPTPFWGRGEELVALRALLADAQVRLLTITGPGGIGKTTLAQEVAQTLAGDFADGAALVRLASLAPGENIVPAMAAALGFDFHDSARRDAETQLLDYLRDKELLLLLDNCEDLQSAALLLVKIVQTAPRVKLLVTSRERLQLQVEQVFPLRGLPLLTWSHRAEAKQDPLVQLFLFHAQRVRPTFALRPEHLQPLRQIFHLVGGMPLAVILAAGWVEVLNPAEIEVELSDSLTFLETGDRDLQARHRSIAAIFDATWQRLQPRERAVLAALSVFRDGFSLQAARAVVGASARDLGQLVGRSLLTRRPGGRFAQHELLRQFAAQKLASDHDAEEQTRAQHARYYSAFLGERGAQLKGEGQRAAVVAIGSDHDNCRAAWAWAAAHRDFALLHEAVDGLMRFYDWRGYLEEGIAACTQARAAVAGLDAAEARRLAIKLLGWQAIFADYLGEQARVQAFLQEAETVLARLQASGAETDRERAFLAQYWGFVGQGYATRRQRLQESLSYYQAAGDTWGVASSQSGLGWMAWTGGEYEEAERRFRESMASFAALGDRLSLARVRTMLSLLNKHLGRMGEAERLLQQSLQSARDLQHRVMEADLLTALAMARRDQGRFTEGIAHVEESIVIWSDLGHLAEVASSETAQAQLLVHLGRFDEARALLAHARPLFGAPNIWSGTNLMTTGMIALVTGDCHSAIALQQEAVQLFEGIGHVRTQGEALAYLTISAFIAGDREEARAHLRTALRQALTTRAVLPAWEALAAAALLALDAGEDAEAVARYARAEQEPFIANSRFFAGVVKSRIDDATVAVAAEEVAAARARGAARDLWTTLDELAQALAEGEAS